MAGRALEKAVEQGIKTKTPGLIACIHPTNPILTYKESHHSFAQI